MRGGGTSIQASPEQYFDLSRDLDLHRRSMAHTAEQAVAGKMTGLIALGAQVTWRGRHFGCLHAHTAQVTACNRPHHFRDAMVRGRFKWFVHDHYFEPTAGGTRMRDVLEFASPLGVLGRVVDALILTRYLRRLLHQRNALIQQVAEAGGS
ncbi:MAG: SRPBCC family protein [Candidatus Tectomicrobia bacterium]|uniref:SRPBCC family protein n=1 Tax=Tectimicrobiota bacterium TaxID=2528274 RepID=A0A937W0F1_UNCTE|nr:SRPBCC family protein [Candidatus Tectomicrobia bacterium]